MSVSMVFTAYVESAEMGQGVHARLLALCSERDVLPEIRIVDVTADPAGAEAGNVVGIPTVVREQPRPRRRVIGALDDNRRVAEALGLDEQPDTQENAGVVDERA
jgi:DNA-directed RNA polymerase subunit H (RpoH/RPB5)